MKSTKHSPLNIFKEAGQGLVEYALILLFVGLAVVLVVSLMEPAIGDVFSRFVAQAPVAPPSLLNYTPPPTFTPSPTVDPDATATPLTPIPSITVAASSTPTPTDTSTPTSTPTSTATNTATAVVVVPCAYGPHIVPSGGSVRVEIEDFRCGGPGVSFSDRTNDGGPGSDDYRTDYGDEGPDLEGTSDSGGGFNLGWTQDNEWLEYEIEAPVTSAYNIVIRHAAINNSNPQVQIRTTSGDLVANTPTLSVGATGGWQNWRDYTAAVTLFEGTNIVRFNIANGNGNYNYFDIQPYQPTPLPGFDLYLEAESGNGLNGQWRTANSGSASGGRYIYWNGNDSINDPPGSNRQVTYSFNAPTAGLHQVHLRVDTGNSGSYDSIWVRIDGADLGQSQNISRSDGWVKFNNMVHVSTWTWDQVHNADSGDALVEFYLPAGSHTLRFGYREAETWIDQIYITNTGNTP